jgi:hypothetical protein
MRKGGARILNMAGRFADTDTDTAGVGGITSEMHVRSERITTLIFNAPSDVRRRHAANVESGRAEPRRAGWRRVTREARILEGLTADAASRLGLLTRTIAWCFLLLPARFSMQVQFLLKRKLDSSH